MVSRTKTNAFDVLQLRTSASRSEVEAQARAVAEAMRRGEAGAADYESPLGRTQRDLALVNRAAVTLRDVNLRLIHELWATTRPAGRLELEPWPDAPRALGWRHA